MSLVVGLAVSSIKSLALILSRKGISRTISESGCGRLGLKGFVVCVQSYKKDSPSSGLFRVKVYNEHGMVQRNGTGMFPREVVTKRARGFGQTHFPCCRWRRRESAGQQASEWPLLICQLAPDHGLMECYPNSEHLQRH
jgi:hypothetical protein